MKLRRGLPLFALCLCVAGIPSSRAQTAEVASAPDPWALAEVEVPDSPRVVRGRLENGLTYAILPHVAPSRQLSLRLLVRAGSLHENDDERGYAHFVEHMAFNGTKHFPAGELVRFLQRQGAEFGPHVNAITTHTRTVYKLDLPEGSPATLETGLRIFRDFSDGLLFERTEVKRERGVILSEIQMRRTPAEAERTALINQAYAGTRIPDRIVIGVPEQIEQADPAGLRRFYEAWYRPDRLSVVIVGDIAPPSAEALIRAHFASLAARGPARSEPTLGEAAASAPPAIAVHPRPLAGADISLVSITARSNLPETWHRRLKGFQARAALGMMRSRLLRLAQQPDAVIHDAQIGMGVDYLRFRRGAISVSAAPNRITDALALVEQELRRAREQGFAQSDLVHQQALLRHEVESLVDSMATAPASFFADSFVDSLEEGSSLSLANELVEPLMQSINRLTAVDCQSVLREFFGEEPSFIFVSCLAPHAPTVEKVRAAYLASRDQPPAPVDQAQEVVFAYEDFGPAGVVVDNNYIADLDLRQLRFANDVRANLKRTASDAGHVQFLVRLGYGRLAEPRDQPGLGLWFPFLWHGGTGRHTADEFRRLLGGLSGIGMRADDDAFVISGRLPVRDLPRALRQLTALASDPAFRDEGWTAARSNLLGQFQPLWNRPEGAVAQFLWPRFAGGDTRLGVPNDSVYLARTAEQFRTWFAPQLATGPIEFSLVGDFDPEAIAHDIASTLGTLPAREPRDGERFATRLEFLKNRRATRYYFNGAADRPSRLEFFWPVRDPVTIRERRLLSLLARVLEARVTDEVREKKGATYFVSADVSWSYVYPGFSFLTCSVDLSPGKVEKHSRTIRKLALRLAEKGIKADELTRAKAQALAAAGQARTNNEYWLEAVLADSQQRPFRLDAARSAESDISSATAAELDALAARYLGPDRVFNYLIEPNARIPKKG